MGKSPPTTGTAPTKRAATRLVEAITIGYHVVRLVGTIVYVVTLFI